MEVLATINRLAIEEHGKAVTIDDLLIDTEVDSFGIVMLLLELDEKYGCFSNEWLKTMKVEELTVQYIVDRVASEGK